MHNLLLIGDYLVGLTLMFAIPASAALCLWAWLSEAADHLDAAEAKLASAVERYSEWCDEGDEIQQRSER